MLTELFESQLTSRHLDFAARRLAAEKRGFYSIGSAGHEGNAALAEATRTTDPALLHYRSGAFYVHRCRKVPDLDPVRDVLLGVVAAKTEPIAGGRHKVFGRAEAAIIPQTSTIASHLPRAVGLAFALNRPGARSEWPADAVVLCTFGDASANHSTATGAINTAIHTAHQGIPVPILFACEDNGIGLSVPTPPGWIRTAYATRPGLRWFEADGTDLEETLATANAATEWVREHREPAFLRLRTVRLLGHAGSDVESGYRSPAELAADAARDPLLATARLLAARGVDVLALHDRVHAAVTEAATAVLAEPRLGSAAEVVAPLAAAHPDSVRADAERTATADETPLTLAAAINHTLAEALTADPAVLVFGEDVARKGGVYGVTKNLRARFGPRRVFDTLLDEQSILGTALGAALAGFLPVPEIQYLAYLHNAADQLRGEAATLPFFSRGRYRNGTVVRIAGYGYQKGFGGHFHNDNAVAALRDIPGLVLASPARADDAAALLRTCLAAARVDGRVCVFLEPIALYHTRDLHEPGDEGWLGAPGAEHVPIGSARRYGTGTDLTLVCFANTVPMCLRVARRLAADGIGALVLDLRWLTPLPADDLLRAARATGRVLVADETRRSGGVSESVLTALLDGGFAGSMARVTSADSFVPLGPAAAHVLLDAGTIERAARDLLRR
ncbi:thiamine pyrophosphate-dependent enzyme [Nocardia harenae]|uniref:thiamine pyrophosphate-dependent enzyme n=1 Tax=Nocardia harenae TaxID=358707 RepID=UPI00082E9DAF|nr:thiamine pyrophosphate-dependent enzyme [Nocardia harenae]